MKSTQARTSERKPPPAVMIWVVDEQYLLRDAEPFTRTDRGPGRRRVSGSHCREMRCRRARSSVGPATGGRTAVNCSADPSAGLARGSTRPIGKRPTPKYDRRLAGTRRTVTWRRRYSKDWDGERAQRCVDALPAWLSTMSPDRASASPIGAGPDSRALALRKPTAGWQAARQPKDLFEPLERP
jgi:hypothetical protein